MSQGFTRDHMVRGHPSLWATDPGLKPPSVAVTGDIEFMNYANGTDPTAGPGLTWGNQSTSTGTVQSGALVMTAPVSTNALRALLIATPGSGNFTAATRLHMNNLAEYQVGFLVFLWGTPASPTAIEGAGGGTYPGNTDRLAWTQHNTSWVPTTDRVVLSRASIYGFTLYVVVDWDGTNLVYKASETGRDGTFRTIYTATLGLGRPDYVGVGLNTGNASGSAIAAFSFLRFGWSGSDYDPTTT